MGWLAALVGVIAIVGGTFVLGTTGALIAPLRIRSGPELWVVLGRPDPEDPDADTA